MKKIVLLGDSIRMGYQDTVKRLLSGRAEVWAPDGNCMHSVHHLFNIHPWYIETKPDILHLNFGLWDCRRLGPDREENAIPVDQFVRNLDFILGKVRAATQARIIWATLTPVVSERYNARFTQPHEPCRDAADSSRYNDAAVPVLEKHGIEVNDLYQFVMDQGVLEMINEDGIHYTERGYQKLGTLVAARLSAHLDP